MAAEASPNPPGGLGPEITSPPPPVGEGAAAPRVRRRQKGALNSFRRNREELTPLKAERWIFSLAVRWSKLHLFLFMQLIRTNGIRPTRRSFQQYSQVVNPHVVIPFDSPNEEDFKPFRK